MPARRSGIPSRQSNAHRQATASGVPPEHFHAHEYAEKYTDNDVTEDQIFARFEPEVREEMAEISKRVKALTQTIETHKPNGKWTPERAALHAKILAKIMSPEARQKARPKAGEKPCLTLLGGRGGSGKSKLKGVCYDPDTAIVLDADEIKKELPEYEGWNAGQVHEESSEVLDRMAVLCRRLNLNVVIDATMKSRDNLVKRAAKYKSAGFSLATHYMFCPKQEAAYRTTSRFLGKDGKRGRYAPVDVVLSNVNNEANFEEVRKMSDKWSFHDNRAEHPVLISEGGNSATGKEK
jgi:predicted ABC-type ATPase